MARQKSPILYLYQQDVMDCNPILTYLIVAAEDQASWDMDGHCLNQLSPLIRAGGCLAMTQRMKVKFTH